MTLSRPAAPMSSITSCRVLPGTTELAEAIERRAKTPSRDAAF